jgi:hypothetical protein
MPKVPMRLLPLLCATLALPACVGGGLIATTPSACSALIPDNWRLGVEGAELPAGDTVGDWIAFADAQTGKLDVANGRTADSLAIIERCEARDAKAVQRSRPKVLGLF